MVAITGTMNYRKRIALIPGGSATVTPDDTSKQDAKVEVIATTTIDIGDRQIPIRFELSAATSECPPHRAHRQQRSTGSGRWRTWPKMAAP